MARGLETGARATGKTVFYRRSFPGRGPDYSPCDAGCPVLLAIRPPNAVYRQLQTFIGKRDSIRPGQDTPKHWFFLRESWQADSAVMYNNRGVATGMPQTGAGDTTRFRKDSLGQAAEQ
ncbi:MAG: hypothetical protein IPK76_10030 [Lewinellaceae bacterium]|nr:hypothetical protein [Lewinellaceae bacterium]